MMSKRMIFNFLVSVATTKKGFMTGIFCLVFTFVHAQIIIIVKEKDY